MLLAYSLITFKSRYRYRACLKQIVLTLVFFTIFQSTLTGSHSIDVGIESGHIRSVQAYIRYLTASVSIFNMNGTLKGADSAGLLHERDWHLSRGPEYHDSFERTVQDCGPLQVLFMRCMKPQLLHSHSCPAIKH